MYFCSACQVYVNETSVSAHDKSTAHLLAATRAPALRKVWLPESNRGYQLLKGMGWQENTGLGARSDGRVTPIATVLKNDRAGLGMPGAGAARVTHTPASALERRQRKRKAQPQQQQQQQSKSMMSSSQRKLQRQQEHQRDRAIGRELYSTGLEGYEEFLR